MPEIKIIMGFPASGKTTRCKNYEAQGFIRCNRDLHGGKLIDLLKSVETQIETGNSVVLDNTYATAESRQAVINIAKKHNVPIHLEIMSTSIEEAQFNACLRAIQQYGKLLDTAELRATKNPNMFPAAVLFAYRKNLEEPTSKEGFDSITHIPFVRKDQGYTNKGIIFDYDGTLRTTKSGAKYPTSIDDIALLPNRQTVLSQIPKEYTLCGVSNQSGVAKGVMSNDTAKALFDHTNQLLEKKYRLCLLPAQSYANIMLL